MSNDTELNLEELRYLPLILFLICCQCLQAQWLPDPLDQREQSRIDQGEKHAKALAHLISKGDSPEDQVRSIYHWVTQHIHYDRRTHRTFAFPTHEVHRTLRRHKATPLGYATLFQRLCDASGIPCKVVLGYAKPADYRIGTRFQRGTHAWNAVQVDGRWQLVDASWGASRLVIRKQPLRAWAWRQFSIPYARRYRWDSRPDDLWCMMPPDSFRESHLPIHPPWQLSDSALSLAAWEATRDTFIPPLMQDHLVAIAAMETLEPADAAQVEGISAKRFNTRDDLDIARAQMLLGQEGLRKPPEAGGDTLLWTRASAEMVQGKQHLVVWMRQVGSEQRQRMKELRQLESATKRALLYARGEWKFTQLDCEIYAGKFKRAATLQRQMAQTTNATVSMVMAPMPRLSDQPDSIKLRLKKRLDERQDRLYQRARALSDSVTKVYRKLQTATTRIYICADSIERERRELADRVTKNLEIIMADSELAYLRADDSLSNLVRRTRSHRLLRNRFTQAFWAQCRVARAKNASVLEVIGTIRKGIEELWARGLESDSVLIRQIFLRETLSRWLEIREGQEGIEGMQLQLEANHISACREMVASTVRPRLQQARLVQRHLQRERRQQNRRFHAEMRLAHHLERRADEGLEEMRRWISEARAAARNQ